MCVHPETDRRPEGILVFVFVCLLLCTCEWTVTVLVWVSVRTQDVQRTPAIIGLLCRDEGKPRPKANYAEISVFLLALLLCVSKNNSKWN